MKKWLHERRYSRLATCFFSQLGGFFFFSFTWKFSIMILISSFVIFCAQKSIKQKTSYSDEETSASPIRSSASPSKLSTSQTKSPSPVIETTTKPKKAAIKSSSSRRLKTRSPDENEDDEENWDQVSISSKSSRTSTTKKQPSRVRTRSSTMV